MKFNVFFENNHGSHWVLSDGSPLFKSRLFESRPEAIDDIELFVTLAGSAVFIESGEVINSAGTESFPLVLVVFKQNNSHWHWELFISINDQSSKIAESSNKGFDSLEQARQQAKLFCNAIVDAPVLDQADVAIPNPWFSKSFANAHNIDDIHPSSKWLK